MELHFDANAKINLSLLVTGQKDGYHLLDSIVATVSLADRVSLTDGHKRAEVQFVRGAVAPPIRADNTVRALDAIKNLLGHESAFHAVIEKNIPDKAGLGGSSAEAASIFRAVCRQEGVSLDDPEVIRLMMRCGSDVPVMARHGLMRLRGRGEQVERLPGIRPLYLAIVKQGAVSTADAFSSFRLGETHNNGALIEALRRGDSVTEQMLVNELLPGVAELCPNVLDSLKQLRNAGASAVGMTGSGSGCFGLFLSESSAKEALNRIHGEYKADCKTVADD